MASHEEQLSQRLRSAGHSLTAARRAVFDALQSNEPLTMNQLVDRCPGVNRSSVYRTVWLFEELGIVKRLAVGWKHKLELSDTFQQHHHHFSCLRCRQSFALAEDEKLEKRLLELAHDYDFAMHDHQLEISGYCSRCRAQVE